MRLIKKIVSWFFTASSVPDFVKFLLLILLSPILLPLILIYIINTIVKNTTFDKDYKNYLHTIEGTRFFCYNNRKTSINFIEQEIIPQLSPEIKIIFVDGRKLQTEYNQSYLSHALYQIKRTAGLPYLLKVINGKIVDCSIHKELFNIINQKKNQEHHIQLFLNKVNIFFQS